MASFKSHPFFFTSLILAGALTAGQAWLLFSQRAAAQRVAAEIEEKKQTLQSFAHQNPFPTRANLEAVEADRKLIEDTLVKIREGLSSSSELATKIASAPVPASRLDAYFDLANDYVSPLSEQARAAGVAFNPENRFGFSTYSSVGPAPDLIASVFRQRQYAEYLVSALLGSSHPPQEFVSLQREHPLTPEQKKQIDEALASGMSPPSFGEANAGGAGDYFTMDPATSARKAGFIETIPFRLTFVGNTAALRAFLNELATFKVPAVVRSVEVEPLVQDGGRQRGPGPRASRRQNRPDFATEPGLGGPLAQAEAEKPIVDQVDSRFIVTLEIVSLVDKKAEAAEASNVSEPAS